MEATKDETVTGVTIFQCRGWVGTGLSNNGVKALVIGNTVNWTAGFLGKKFINPAQPARGTTNLYDVPAMSAPVSFTVTEATDAAAALAASAAAVAASLYTLHY